MGASYLIRFDDICPTMNWSIWDEVEEALVSFAIKPILAVVPDNHDPQLRAGESNLKFWERVRAWQGRGWTIGLHGCQHLALTRDGGILRINHAAEFSGLGFDVQKAKLRQALAIFSSMGVRPDLWVAPWHSFDANTLRALRDFGICCLSDGFSLYPYLDSSGILWIPQQLWKLRRVPFGVWTVCVHANQWSGNEVAQFRSELRKFAAAITDCNSVVSLYGKRRRSVADKLFSGIYPTALKARRRLTAKRRERSGDTPVAQEL
jgi:predicted deacetylase